MSSRSPKSAREKINETTAASDVGSSKDARRMREYAEQLMIFVVGLLGAALILYVGKVFAPYIYPAAMAALISIPIAALNRRVNDFLAQTLSSKLHTFRRPKCLLVVSALLISMSSLAGLHWAVLILCGLLLAFLSLRRLGPRMFLLVTILGTGFLVQLLLTNCVHEVILLSSDVVQRHSKFDAAFVDDIYTSLGTVDSLMKGNAGVGLYEAGTMAMQFFEKEVDGAGVSAKREEQPPPRNSKEASVRLIAELNKIRSELTVARVISRFQSLFSYEQVMQAALYLAHLISTLFLLLVGSAQNIIKGATFVYFLFYFIGQRESVLRYAAVPFVRVPEVQIFVEEIEEAFEFVVRQYGEQILSQVALSYVSFRLCGVHFAMVLAVLAGLLEMFPFMPPTIVAPLAAAEIFFTNSLYMALLCVAIHWAANWLLMPRLTLFKSPRSGYFAELSVLVGFWTFGSVGLVLGPVLACIPTIIYRLFAKEMTADEDKGLTMLAGEGSAHKKKRSSAKVKSNKE